MIFRAISYIINGFSAGWKSANDGILYRDVVKKDKDVRDSLTETQLDKMLKNTFPASNPVTIY